VIEFTLPHNGAAIWKMYGEKQQRAKVKQEEEAPLARFLLSSFPSTARFASV
jgi:hypothetical protein